jgi:hypothetical protein
MRLFLFSLCATILISCGTSVGIDYDTENDFSKYSTYNFYPDLKTGLSELDENRIIKITDSILKEKGLMKTDNPHLLINFYSSEHISRSRNTIGIGMGSVGRNTSVGVSTGIPVGGNEINQQLTVDIIDASLDALVWQAKSDGSFKERATPEQRESYYQKTLNRIFQKFPPKL